MSDFKGRRFPTDVILLCVRWYCKFGISYRDLKEMMSERGVAVDHTTLFRWVQHFTPLMEKRIRWYQRYTDTSWRVDETYVKVAGQWALTINTDQNEAYGKAIRALKRVSELDKSVQHRQVKLSQQSAGSGSQCAETPYQSDAQI
jgi:transposase-like protein